MWIVLRQICAVEMQQIAMHSKRETALRRAQQLGLENHRITRLRVAYPQKPYWMTPYTTADAVAKGEMKAELN